MKSVVVEGSTVAKAIELAWQKAEKPEEFFIRILQEHSNGFLGFGAQKAKIVLFFKNSQKSDSIFPSVLKQKEYANLFDNKNLKNPEVVNFVDTQVNKNVHVQAKKQNNQQKHSQPVQKKAEQVKQIPLSDTKNQSKKEDIVPAHNQQHNKQNQQKKNELHGIVQSKNIEKNTQKQAPIIIKKVVEKLVEASSIQKVEHKDGAVRDVAQALKKVQSQKIIANVSKKPQPLPGVEKKSEIVENSEKTPAQSTQQPLRFKRRQLQVTEGDISGITFVGSSNNGIGLQESKITAKPLVLEQAVVLSSTSEQDLQNMVDKAADLVKNIQPMKDIVFARDTKTEQSFGVDSQSKKDY